MAFAELGHLPRRAERSCEVRCGISHGVFDYRIRLSVEGALSSGSENPRRGWRKLQRGRRPGEERPLFEVYASIERTDSQEEKDFEAGEADGSRCFRQFGCLNPE